LWAETSVYFPARCTRKVIHEVRLQQSHDFPDLFFWISSMYRYDPVNVFSPLKTSHSHISLVFSKRKCTVVPPVRKILADHVRPPTVRAQYDNSARLPSENGQRTDDRWQRWRHDFGLCTVVVKWWIGIGRFQPEFGLHGNRGKWSTAWLDTAWWTAGPSRVCPGSEASVIAVPRVATTVDVGIVQRVVFFFQW